MNSCLVLLIGVPGAGKSTLARSLVALQNPSSLSIQHVCIDTLLTSPQFSPEAWRAARVLAMERATSCIELAQSTNQPTLIVIDDTLHYRSMRYEYFQLARQLRIPFLQIYLQCPLDLALERNATRPTPQLVPTTTLLRTASILEEPDGTKHAFERDTLIVDAMTHQVVQQTRPNQPAEGRDDIMPTTNSTSRLLEIIMERVATIPPPPPPPNLSLDDRLAQQVASTSANAASMIHQADLYSRRILHEALARLPTSTSTTRSSSSSLHASCAKRLADARRDMMAALRRNLAAPGASHDATNSLDEAMRQFEQTLEF